MTGTLNFSKPYLLADYAEWLVVGEGRGEVSKGDLMMEAQVHQDLEQDFESDTRASGSSLAEAHRSVTNRRDTQLDDCFAHFQFREKAFGDAYVFKLDKDVLKQKTPASSADEVLVYKFLLACGRPEAKTALPMAFSELCKEALSRLMGARGVVFNIDAGSDDRQTLGVNTRDMARNLAEILGCSVIEEYVDQLSGQGDGGADIVAAVPFADGASGHVAILGQCAATSDEGYWKNKLAEAKRLESLYIWGHRPVMAAFVPVVYRSGNGSWISQSNVFDSVFFDRLRILSALRLRDEALSTSLREELKGAIAKDASKAAAGPKARKKK